jgi:hypothetical protein
VSGAAFERLAVAPAFVSGMLETDITTFAELRVALSDLLYTPGRAGGVVPYATGCLRHGKCPVVAVAESRDAAADLLNQAQMMVEGVCLSAR